MSENWAIALIIFVLGQFVACIGSGIATTIWLIGKIAEAEKTAEHRFTKLEGQAEKWFVLAGSAGLHHEIDKLKCDKDIEDFVISYHNGKQDMPAERWIHFRDIFWKIHNNPKATPDEQMLALGYVDLCEHKMTRNGVLTINPRPI